MWNKPSGGSSVSSYLDDIVIASSQSSDRLKSIADYVCDGHSDQEEINQAINSLTDMALDYGKSIVLLGGAFLLDGPIVINDLNPCIKAHERGRTYLYLEDSDTGNHPSVDWFMFQFNGLNQKVCLENLELTGLSYNNWDYPSSFKGLLGTGGVSSYDSAFIDIINCYFYADVPFKARSSLSNSILIEETEFTTDSGSGNLLDLSSSTGGKITIVHSKFSYGDCAFYTNNPSGCTYPVFVKGEIETEALETVFDYTPQNITGIGTSLFNVHGDVVIDESETYIEITHGSLKKPTVNDIWITPLNNLGNATKYYVTNITETTFRINLDVAPGAGNQAEFAWRIISENSKKTFSNNSER